MRTVERLFLLTTALTVSRSGFAQVNVEPLRQQVEAQGFGGEVKASLSALRGNVDQLALSGAAFVGARVKRDLAFLQATGDYSQVNEELVVEKMFAHARYNRKLVSGVWWEAFAQVERDAFRSIRVRELTGTGPRFGWSSDANGVFLGTAWMLENTVRAEPLVGETSRQYLVQRWSNYLSSRSRIDDRIVFAATLYLQPRFDRFSDYRALVSGSLEFEITDVLSTGIETTVRYESRVPRGFARADGAFKNFLSATF